MNKKTSFEDLTKQEDGEEELFVLIKQAGDEARKRRQQTLDRHYIKLKEGAAKATASCMKK